jgi:RNA polymerase sigma-70 factor (ECF subfamily)
MTFRNGGGGRDDERFKSLYEKYYRRMLRFFTAAFRLSNEDAEELVQDTFLRFFEAMDEYRGEAEWGYLESIARNVAYNRIRSKRTAKRGAPTIDLDNADFLNHEPSVPPVDFATKQQEALWLQQLRDAIAGLPPGQRQCIQLWLAGMKYGEIAKVLRITLDAVRSRLRDARRLLHSRLGDGGLLPEDEE